MKKKDGGIVVEVVIEADAAPGSASSGSGSGSGKDAPPSSPSSSSSSAKPSPAASPAAASKDTKDDVQVVVPGEETASVWSVDHWITALNVWAAWALAEWRLQPLWNADRTHRGGAPLHGYACMCGAAQSHIGQPCVPDLTLGSTQTSRRCLGDP